MMVERGENVSVSGCCETVPGSGDVSEDFCIHTPQSENVCSLYTDKY